MLLYVVVACCALAAFLLTFALVREARLRRALATLLSMILDRNRNKHETNVVNQRVNPSGDSDGL